MILRLLVRLVLSQYAYNHGTPGDPQSAVGNLGDIVLFVQLATARFKVIGYIIDILSVFNAARSRAHLNTRTGLLI